MRLRGSVFLLMTMAVGAGLPSGRLHAQKSPEFRGTLRVAAGPGRGDGGNYTGRRLNSFLAALDFTKARGDGAGLMLGFGFTHYESTGHQSVPAYAAQTRGTPIAVEIVCIAAPCTPYHLPAAFPDANVGYLDVGWRRVARHFRFDAILQPGVAFVSRPDVVPLAWGGSFAVARRVVGSFEAELGTSATYLPSFDGARLGLRQLTVGLRSW